MKDMGKLKKKICQKNKNLVLNMFSERKNVNKILEKLDKLIVKGINITRLAQEGDAIYHSSSDLVDDAHREYIIWKDDIKKLLNQEKIVKKIDIGILYQSDSIPNFKGGLEYGDVRSEKSQKLLKSIRIETSKKLEFLREVNSKLSEERIEKKLIKFVRKNIVKIIIGIIVVIISNLILANWSDEIR